MNTLYERGVGVTSHSIFDNDNEKQADIIEAFNSTSGYVDDISNINNIYFDKMLRTLHPADFSDTDSKVFVYLLCI